MDFMIPSFSDWLRLMRPAQWIKNLFVFFPAIFGGGLLDARIFIGACESFIIFCLLASSIYVINDIRDREADRAHPEKCRRPIASGRISKKTAVGFALTLDFLWIFLTYIWFGFRPEVWAIVGGYFLMNLAYSMGLKQVAIVDVFIVSAGFVLRVLMGGVVCRIWVSPWLIMMVLLGTLLIAFGKRRDDVLLMEAGHKATRKSITTYNIQFINQVLSMLSAATIVAYVCYTLSPAVEERFGSEYIYLTSIFVIAALLRYLQIAVVFERSGRPTQILYGDRFIVACALLWMISFLIIIYC
ncbi:MAG: decaprenyl-phosphate phosphoribosyltransferase [Muribaculaceae bacterium]|nr:decaprenyl-phosphate phosphoribosyltransferase [Muribaculaceae bacterium]